LGINNPIENTHHDCLDVFTSEWLKLYFLSN
jgi:hypothetical protein